MIMGLAPCSASRSACASGALSDTAPTPAAIDSESSVGVVCVGGLGRRLRFQENICEN